NYYHDPFTNKQLPPASPPLILSVIYFSLFSCISKRLSILLRNILFTLNKQL
ncbi:hypothetical protein BACCELL_04290, partial [Bacteroides cellulosilyticus DSM 14838]